MEAKRNIYKKAGDKLCKVTVSVVSASTRPGKISVTIVTKFSDFCDALEYAVGVGEAYVHDVDVDGRDGGYTVVETAVFYSLDTAKEWINACFSCDKEAAETALANLEGAA